MKWLLLPIFILLNALFALPVDAASEFSTSFYSTYTIEESGQAKVEHQIDIKNNLAHVYTTEYTVSIGTGSLTDLTVLVSGEQAPFREESTDSATTLNITIPQAVIGKDQVLPIFIQYQTDSLTDKYGGVMEINIPRLNRANEASLYTRKIIIPSVLGTPEVETPRPTSRTTTDSGEIVLEYVGYPAESITLLFGKYVSYQLDLTYQLTNPSLAPADTELALPPDTEYQSIILAKLVPNPSKIRLDADGNWLAVYPLKSQETKEVRATLFAQVYPLPVFPSLVTDLDNLVKPTDYWETKATSVKSLAVNLKTPLNIYNYLIENVTYDYERIKTGERLGAEKTLAAPSSAICTEFADTFVALARSSGTPAREINGYARTADTALRPAGFSEDILHAWPEYYDSERKSWVQVDPTWGRTTGGVNYFEKLDYGHITFVRHGQESDYPLPAGSYKANPGEKTISVTIADQVPAITRTYEEGRAGDKYTVTNTGNVALRNFPVTLSNGASHTLYYLPPYGTEVLSSNSLGTLNFFEKILQFFKNLF